jgi:hypothetical protein
MGGKLGYWLQMERIAKTREMKRIEPPVVQVATRLEAGLS